ncbi:MAG TPA: PrsW family glutamic-type intramembrane protease [Geodermatophilus sp.]|nr:PrsW family glutamic-type intramembrane protease [Geodermatophilus sp.]
MHTDLVAPAGTGQLARYRRWSWVLVLVVGTVLYEVTRRAVLATGNPRLLPTLILLGAAVVPVTVVAFISGRRMASGVSGGAIMLTAVLGGFVGVLAAGTVEFDTRRSLGVLPLIAVGLIEELTKLLGPAAVLAVLRRPRPADGLLLGVASGAGFAVLETMGYAFVALVRSGGDLSAVDELLLYRGLASPAAHLAWTGVAAAALWRAAAEHWRGAAVARFVGTYLLVAVLHAGWDGARGRWTAVGVALVSLALLTWTVHRLAESQRR